MPSETKALPGPTTPTPPADAALSPPPPATAGAPPIPHRPELAAEDAGRGRALVELGICCRDSPVAARSSSLQSRRAISSHDVPDKSDISDDHTCPRHDMLVHYR